MRFMMLMIPKGYENAAPGTMPDAKAVEAMMKYNEALQQAGVQFDVMALLELLGQYMNLPELSEIVSIVEPMLDKAPGGDGGGPKMPPNTTREYLRHSSGGDTSDNREKMIANMSSPTQQEPAMRSPE